MMFLLFFSASAVSLLFGLLLVMSGFLLASRGLLRFGQIALVLAGGLGAFAVVLVVGLRRFGGAGALAVFGGVHSIFIFAALGFQAHLAFVVQIVSFSVLPVLFLLPLFGAVPGLVRLFLLIVLLFALGLDCAVARMVL